MFILMCRISRRMEQAFFDDWRISKIQNKDIAIPPNAYKHLIPPYPKLVLPYINHVKNTAVNLLKNRKEPITAFSSACYRLCVCASGSLITDILSCFTLISVSCLHFGQNSGKCSSTVSSLIFKRVLLLQIGQSTHSLFMLSLNFFTKSLQIWRQLFSATLG